MVTDPLLGGGVALSEREELTAGSTRHAAGGFHAMNADTRTGTTAEIPFVVPKKQVPAA